MEGTFFDVGINLRGGYVGVPEEFLDDTEVGATAEEVGGETVSHQVRVHVGLEAGTGGVLVEQLADPRGGELFSSDG